MLAHRMPPGHAETHRRPLAVSTQGLKRLSPSLRAVSSHCSRGRWLHQVGGLTSRMPVSHAQCLVSLAPAIPREQCTRRVHSLGPLQTCSCLLYSDEVPRGSPRATAPQLTPQRLPPGRTHPGPSAAAHGSS